MVTLIHENVYKSYNFIFINVKCNICKEFKAIKLQENMFINISCKSY